MVRWTLIMLFLLAAPALFAQEPSEPQSPPNPLSRRPTQEQDNGAIPDEMRTRMEIARADSDHKKLLESAKQLGDLSAEVEKKYLESSALGGDEYKKLNSIEKLAKKILSDSGGSRVDEKGDELNGVTVGDAISRLKKAAVAVEHQVTIQTRFVVSAAVISQSNEVIRLTQYIRKIQRAD